ncbi:MAG: divergent polysaccharide deacetylase family protein [Dongiaceae bacterium]
MALIAALGVAAAAAGVGGWLWLSGDGPSLLSATPRVEIELDRAAPAIEPPAPGEAAMSEPPAETALASAKPPSAEPGPPAIESTAPASPAGPDERVLAPDEAAMAPPPPPAAPVVGALPGEPAAEALPAWRRFARDFPADDPRPRIAVVVTGLGLSATATDAAIRGLPGEITLAFSPYGSRLAESVALARAAGHEVMLDLPLEPASYPRDDPGPQGLLTSLTPTQNRARLDWVLDRAEGYVGVAAFMGSRFTASADHMRPVLSALAERDLMFLDGDAPDSVAARLAEEIGVPLATTSLRLGDDDAPAAIDSRLQQLERQARTAGFAVATVAPAPAALERLGEWARTLPGKGLALAPISALAAPGPPR